MSVDGARTILLNTARKVRFRLCVNRYSFPGMSFNFSLFTVMLGVFGKTNFGQQLERYSLPGGLNNYTLHAWTHAVSVPTMENYPEDNLFQTYSPATNPDAQAH